MPEFDVEDDPDAVDGNVPKNQYDNTDVPLNANIADRRARADEAGARNQLRERYARAPANPAQARPAGVPVDAPVNIPRVNIRIDPIEPNYVQMVLMDAAPPDNVQQGGNGGVEAAGNLGQQNEYGVVSYEEMQASLTAAKDAIDALKAEAAVAKAAQDALAAKTARMRKFTITNGVLGGVSFLATLGAILYALFGRAKKTTGPSAFNLDGGDSLDPTQKATVDVARQALPGDGGDPIDKTSVEFVTHDTGNTKKKTMKDIGLWAVASDGTVSFTPDAKFGGGTTNILYTIADTKGVRSLRAQISFFYKLKTVAGTGGPKVKSFSAQHTVNEVVTIDVVAAATPGPGGGAINPASVALIGGDAGHSKEKFQVGLGTWTASATGEITFTPIVGFLGGLVQMGYGIADSQGNTSDSGEIALSYFMRPRVQNIVQQIKAFTPGTALSVNVVDGSSGFAKPVTDPALSVDATSVILTGVMKSEGEEIGPNATATAGMKQLVVVDEGTWDASDPTGKITFTPDPKLTDDPHPISYQVADSKGVFSTVGMLTLSSAAAKVYASLGAINNLDDASFWSMYETKVVKGDLGDDPVNRLLLMRAITSDLWLNTANSFSDDDRNIVFTLRDTLIRGVLSPDFDTWRAGTLKDAEPPMSPAKLFTMSKTYDDNLVNLPNTLRATRYIRLTYIHLMLGFFARFLDDQNSGRT